MKSIRLAAHVHSSWSYDGQWPLEKIARAFRWLRCDVVLMAEHDRGFDEPRWNEYQQACRDTSTEDMLLVPGIEYSDPDNVVHVVVWGDSVPFLGAGKDTLDVLLAARDHDAVTLFAHPWRRDAVLRYRPTWAPLLTGAEIWNRKYDGVAPNPRAKTFVEQENLTPFVSLDFHTGRQLMPLALSASSSRAKSLAEILAMLRSDAFRPELLTIPAVRLTRGAGGTAIRSLERTRRIVRQPMRRLETELARSRRARR